MKLPEYSLKTEVVISNGQHLDSTTFPPGTLIMPFWNEGNLPSHIKDILREQPKIKDKKYIMCLIGRTWVPVLKENIRQN